MKSTARTALVFVAGLGLGAGAAVIGARWQAGATPDRVTTAAVFERVLRAIEADFVDSLSNEELYVKAAKGVVNTLGDPYSAFLGPEEFRRYSDLLKGRGATFGFAAESGLTGLRIATIVPGTPADRAGLKPGHLLLEIGGVSSRRWTQAEAAAAIRPDSAGLLTVRTRAPGDSAYLEVALTATTGRLPAVSAIARLSDSVGYLALGTVSDQASTEVRAALEQLGAANLSGLVLDLRGNRGGRLDEGLAVADIFLPDGKQIGTVAKRRFRWGYASAHPEAYPRLKLTVLVDRHTASSAEIIAAALRDNDRARLVGERTFGKGLIQTTIPLGDSIAVRLTTGRWQGPGGELLAGGLKPDSVVHRSAWTTSVIRALAPRSELLDEMLTGFARRRIVDGTSADSVRLDRTEVDQIRARLRASGLPLSRRTMAFHRALFDGELARLVGAALGGPEAAVRFGLLTDPVVRTALSLQRHEPSPPLH